MITPTRDAWRRRQFALLALAFATALCAVASGTWAQPPEDRGFDLSFPHSPDELLAGLTPAPADRHEALRREERRGALYEQLHIRELAHYPRIQVAHLQIPTPGGDEALKRVAAALAAHPDLFEYVDPNRRVYLTQGPSPDPKFGDQWAPAKIEAPAAWSITPGSASVVVAVIDSGIDATHKDLGERVWKNPCELVVAGGGIPAPVPNGSDDPCPGGIGNGKVDDLHGWSFVGTGSGDVADDMDHGSQVAGVIGAIHDNGVCIKGLNRYVSLMPLRVVGATEPLYVGGVVGALEYAVDASADVVNASWTIDYGDQNLLKALQDARKAEILVVAAAGHPSEQPVDLDTNKSYPCSFLLPNVICVAATTPNDDLQAGSSWGKGTVHLGAPGEAIYSTARAQACNTSSGPSMAAPHAAGVAALIRAKCPNSTVDDIRERLLEGDAAPLLVGKTISGKRLNARCALERACPGRFQRLRRPFERLRRRCAAR